MGLGDRLGQLKVDYQADLVLLKRVRETTDLVDVLGETRTAAERLAPMMTFKRGRLHRCA